MVRSAKVVAFNTDLDCAQAFIFSRDNIHLMVVISSSGDDVFTPARQAVLDLQEEFFESEESISKRFSSLGDAILDRLSSVERVGLMLAAFKSEDGQPSGSGGILYLQEVGQSAVYLNRQGKTLALVSQEQEGRLISGYLQPGDRVLLISDNLYPWLSADPSSLDTLITSPIDQFEEVVNGLENERQDNSPLAAILIDYNLEEKLLPNSGFGPTLPAVSKNHRLKLSRVGWLISPNLLVGLFSRIKVRVPQENRGRLYLGGTLLVIILFGVIITSHFKANKQKQAELQSDLAQASQELSTAESLKGLDMVAAETELNKAKTSVAQAQALEPKNSQAADLLQKISQSQDDILKVYRVISWPAFLDLGLIKDGFSASRLSLDSGQMLLLDPQSRTLVSIDINRKSNQILAGSAQLGQAQIADLSSQIAAVYSSDKGVTQVDTQGVKSTQAIKLDSSWGKITQISVFANNIYLLDEFNNQIWKYVPTSNGYSDKQPYLSSGVKVDLAGSKKMLIDGSIWVLKAGNQIGKFTGGEVDSFNLSGLDQDLKDLVSFYVSSDTNNIYLLDSGNSRVVVVGKDGKYIAQYVGDKFKTATDIAVDESNKKLYILDSNTIYQVDLH